MDGSTGFAIGKCKKLIYSTIVAMFYYICDEAEDIKFATSMLLAVEL